MTLQFCLWDQFKALNTLPAAQLPHLARLAATLLAKEALPLTCLKVSVCHGLAHH
jgi:hypothetical protein